MRTQSSQYLDFILMMLSREPQSCHTWTSDLQNQEIINGHYFKLISLWQFVQQQWKTNTLTNTFLVSTESSDSQNYQRASLVPVYSERWRTGINACELVYLKHFSSSGIFRCIPPVHTQLTNQELILSQIKLPVTQKTF